MQDKIKAGLPLSYPGSAAISCLLKTRRFPPHSHEGFGFVHDKERP
jgi:hypothetical protein